MPLVIEVVKVQLCQVNREQSVLELAVQDMDKQSWHIPQDKGRPKRERFKKVNQDYQEGRVYPWQIGISRPRRPCVYPLSNRPQRDDPQTSDSERPTENPSTGGEGAVNSNPTVHSVY